jgi:hypothetical protein
VPPPVYPSLQVTVTVSPVLPEIEPAADLSELATATFVQAFALHPVPEKLPSTPQVQVPPPVYPSLQETVTVSPVLP